MRRGLRPPLPPVLALAFLAIAVALPVGLVVGRGLVGAERAATLSAELADPVTVRALESSLLQGALAAAGALAIGAPAGFALGRYRFPGRDLLSGVLLVPFLLPTLTMVIALGALFGPAGRLGGPIPALRPLAAGLPGVIAADVLYNAPIVALLTAVGVEASSGELEETVRTLGGSPWRAFRDAWGPPALAGAAAGAALTFALSALAFAAPIAIGGPANFTVEARVWSLDQQLAEPGAAAVVAALGLVVLAPAALVYLALLRWLSSRRGTGRRPALARLRREPGGVLLVAALAALTGLELLLLASVLLPLFGPAPSGVPGGSALAGLFSAAATARIGLPLAAALGNGLAFAALAAGIALLVGLGLAVPRHRSRRAARRTIAAAPMGALLVSPVILALGLAGLAGPAVGIGGVWLLIVLSQAVLALPFVAQSLAVALGRVPPRLAEAARSLGSSPSAAFLEVELPAAGGGVAAAGLLAVALCLGEFTATYFLAVPRFTTATVALYRLDATRWVPEAEALAGLLALVSAVLLAAASVGGRRVAL